MNSNRYFDNPNFRTYIELLGQLHTLIRDNRDESREGDELRDRMDQPGSMLSDEEIAEAKVISADFYKRYR
jgi:hypothetical protein